MRASYDPGIEPHSAPPEAGDRYTVISSDCHAGADLLAYRDYLPAALHDDFDAWAPTFVNPFGDLDGPDADQNWDSTRRLRELAAEGIVGEVVFPNTVPPFFPASAITAPPPSAADFALRWAGLQAHNRWLADFCAEAPLQRAGIAQILLNDVDAAVAEIHWARQHGLRGGILLPGVPPGSPVPPLYAPDYDPIWQACAELEMPVNHHSGSAVPDPGMYAASGAMFIVEITWFSHRALWHLMFGGVFERFPDLKLVLTEQSAGWIPGTLDLLDFYLQRFRSTLATNEMVFAGAVADALSRTPHEYWAANGYVGASFQSAEETALRHEIGVDKIMWGSDFPHTEGTQPYTLEALRLAFAGVAPTEVAAMVGGNAAALYGFDLDALAPLAAEVGPLRADVARPLTAAERPTDAMSPVFQPSAVRPW